jgi:ankyrin repeat protein
MQVLVEARAELDQATPRGSMTALHLASDQGMGESVGFLVEAGADVTARNRHGETPLERALAGGHHTIP